MLTLDDRGRPVLNARNLVLTLIVLVVLVLALVLPGIVNTYRLFIVTQVLVFAIAGMGMTVLLGWSGQVAMAQAGFFGVGAYATAFLHSLGAPWIVAMLLAGLIALVLGVLVGLPAVRLRGFYLAIATLAFGELLVRVFISADGITGGVAGRSVDSAAPPSLDRAAFAWYASLVTFVVVTAVLAWAGRSKLGRVLQSIRFAEPATGSLGLSSAKYKLIAFGISAFLGGIAGALYGQQLGFIEPHTFGFVLLIQFLVVAFVGGVTRLGGALLGAAFVVIVQEWLQDLGALQSLLYGLALILVIRFLPDGLSSIPRVAADLVKRNGARARRGASATPDPDEVETETRTNA